MRSIVRNNSLLRIVGCGLVLGSAAMLVSHATAEPLKLLGAPGDEFTDTESVDNQSPAAIEKTTRAQIRELVVREALYSDVPPALALAVAKVESNFNPSALSSKGARGVMQIMPATAKGEFDIEADSLWDPHVNVRLGVEFLAQLYNHYGNRWDAALSHYYGGALSGNSPHLALPPERTRSYIASVLAWRDRYEQSQKVRLLIARVESQLDDNVEFAGSPFSAEAARVAARISSLRSSNSIVAIDGYPVSGETPSMELYREINSLRRRFRSSLRMINNRNDYRHGEDWPAQ